MVLLLGALRLFSPTRRAAADPAKTEEQPAATEDTAKSAQKPEKATRF